MAQPRKWSAFLKRNIRQARANHNNDYAAALADVSASWKIVKARRAGSGTAGGAVAIATRTALEEAARLHEEDEGLLGKEGGDERIPTAEELAADLSVWRGGRVIGGRQPNEVTIWFRLDGNGHIADRRVIKSISLIRQDWTDVTKWTTNITDLDNRIHMDYLLQKRVCEVANGGTHFARVRGYRNFCREWMYRTIADYCDAGSLQDVMKANDYSKTPRSEGETPIIPEPLVWHVFEQLLKAVLVMEQGGLDGPRKGWKQIIHRDMKPDNVFLSMTTGSKYPDVKLSDFEFAIETSADDPFNPQVWRADRAGHRGISPFELRTDDSREQFIAVMKEEQDRDVVDLADSKILAAANVNYRMKAARNSAAGEEDVDMGNFQFPQRRSYVLGMDPFIAQEDAAANAADEEEMARLQERLKAVQERDSVDAHMVEEAPA